MAKGALWMGLLRIADRTVGLISIVILARLLVPEDFGIVAMATSVVAFLELATAFSFDVQLIQKQDTDRSHFDTAWTLNVLFYIGLTIALILLAEPAAAFYQEERLTSVIYVLAAGFLIKGFESNGVVHFRKELDFQKDFILMLSRKLAGFLIAIPLAFYFRSYWALIFGIVAGNLVGLLLTYILHPFRPKFGLSQSRGMLNFSKWLVLNNVINFLRLRSPDFVIGRISGSASLGLFSIAHEIATLPTTELVAPINRAVFPGYSKLAGNLQLLRNSYLDVLGIIAFLALPAGLGIYVIAEPLVDLVLGEEWAAAAPLVAMLAIYGAANAIRTNSGSIFFAMGKPQLMAVIGTLNILILVTLAVPLAYFHGPMGVALSYVVAFTLILPVTFFFVCKELELWPSRLIGVLWRPTVSAGIMLIVLSYLGSLLSVEMNLNSVGLLAILIPAGVIIYATVSLLLWFLAGRPRSPEYRLMLLAYERIRRKRPLNAV